MSHFANAPEALLGRNDSKNPSTTCRGITSSGRPCRRALATPKTSPRNKQAATLNGPVTVVEDGGMGSRAETYCWQHQEQAEHYRVAERPPHAMTGRRVHRTSMELPPLQDRSSIDTLVQRLGIDTLPTEIERRGASRKDDVKPVQSPRRTATIDFALHPSSHNGTPDRPKPKLESKGFWASLCCMAGDSDDYVEIVRHRRRTQQPRPTSIATPTSAPRKEMVSKHAHSFRTPGTSIPAQHSISRPSVTQQDSGTTQLLSLIPPSLSPQTTADLLTELSKPLSPHDEAGYIYIFWLTPQTEPAPDQETARSLLAPDRHPNERRISDVMSEFSFAGSEPETRETRTIMLKIGRANNVTRRMNEWQRQCGYALNLVRWYPYISSSPGSPLHPPPSRGMDPRYPDLSRPASSQRCESGQVVHKVPIVKRVERLIHLELAGKQVKRQCAVCQREHREWFEVEASHAGVKAVDECVKRWVRWAERQEMK